MRVWIFFFVLQIVKSPICKYNIFLYLTTLNKSGLLLSAEQMHKTLQSIFHDLRNNLVDEVKRD